MYTLHESYMPAETRDELLQLVKEKGHLPRRSSPFQAAEAWFHQAIVNQGYAENEVFVHGDAWRFASEPNNGAFSSDMHTDDTGKYSEGAIKFLLNVANNSRQGTLFFSDDPRTESLQRSEQVFRKTRSGALALKPHVELACDWQQAAVGQLVSLSLSHQYHAAAPHFSGDIKITFSAVLG